MPEMKLGFSVLSNGTHKGGWRDPSAWTGGGLTIDGWAEVVAAAERACAHFIFWRDGVAVRVEGKNAADLRYSGSDDQLEPLTLISALSQVARKIGFIATVSTTYNPPYNLARWLASMDHISKGRIGWNVVTSANLREAQNFGLEDQIEHDERYKRAEEYLEVVTGLWDSWADDAFLRDKPSGHYLDPERLHTLSHKGKYYSVRGPLNVPRPVQGYPVIAQAGQSIPGQELGARTADIIYTAQTSIEGARTFYDSVKGRLAKFGRRPDELIVMPGLLPIIGRTDAEAKERYEELKGLIHPTAGLNFVAQYFGDLSRLPQDGPLPDIDSPLPLVRMWVERTRREKMSIREFYQAYCMSAGHLLVVGSPRTIADLIEEWLTGGACDGFNIMAATMPTGITSFCDLVVPELQRRGLHRTDYQGRTLRENLGLARPRNQFFG